MKNTIKFNTDKLFTNITDQVQTFLDKGGCTDGLVTIYSPHTTCCIWLTEDELLHHADVRFFLDKMAPMWKNPEGDQKNIKYLHDILSLRADVSLDEPINGHSHIRSMFFGSSESVPVIDSKLCLGKWKQIFIVELDPNRDREVLVTYLGEKE
jgi:secondary thiamine-phosphate synthase enzyme|tara:strand:+ start:516 stop:974 length:459 start_codon:yes stop_codon:yes gene_type:complete